MKAVSSIVVVLSISKNQLGVNNLKVMAESKFCPHVHHNISNGAHTSSVQHAVYLSRQLQNLTLDAQLEPVLSKLDKISL
jgi:hypothetical protein